MQYVSLANTAVKQTIFAAWGWHNSNKTDNFQRNQSKITTAATRDKSRKQHGIIELRYEDQRGCGAAGEEEEGEGEKSTDSFPPCQWRVNWQRNGAIMRRRRFSFCFL